MEVEFDELRNQNLVIDCIYKGGKKPNISSEPLHKLIPGCENAGGIRKKLRKNPEKIFNVNKHVDKIKKYAYVVLYTSLEELEWPDYLDKTTGILKYYGDNRQSGRELTDTKKKGNEILEHAFALLNDSENRKYIPPFFVFKKTGVGRDVQFLGLAVPGNRDLSADKELVAFWRTVKDNRFQNYEAYFTILDTGNMPISRKWIESLIDSDVDDSVSLAPKAWQDFIENGREGIKALEAPNINLDSMVPESKDQRPDDSDVEGYKCLDYIRNHYKNFSQGFEACAVDIVKKMDQNFIEFNLTRPWRDGGRDALGIYRIRSSKNETNPSLKIECALEAKCYSASNGVGVESMSRLISRIKNRQFGIMVTTSYVDKQAYKEVIEDGHPILIVTAKDIAEVLRNNSINSSNIDKWLDSIDKKNPYNNAKSNAKP